jgi:hypothetical protein
MAKDRKASGAAITGAGAVTAGTGFVAGGVPGAKANVRPITEPTPGVRGQARKAKAVPAGILGFRHNAHAGGLYGFKQKATENAWKGPPQHAQEAYSHGRAEGKIHPEEQVLRHLKGAKRGAGLALAGGAAATAYGVRRMSSEKVKKSRREDTYSGAAVGAGAAGLGVTHGAHGVLRGQQRKWSEAAADNVAAAGRLVPSVSGQGHSEAHIKRGEASIKRNPNTFRNVHPNVAQEAGRLRGSAIQHAHFAHVYGSTAKVVGRLRTPSAVVAGAGAGGLALSRKKDKMKKNQSARMSAFGVEH